jgi:hypothetical protein
VDSASSPQKIPQIFKGTVSLNNDKIFEGIIMLQYKFELFDFYRKFESYKKNSL